MRNLKTIKEFRTFLKEAKEEQNWQEILKSQKEKETPKPDKSSTLVDVKITPEFGWDSWEEEKKEWEAGVEGDLKNIMAYIFEEHLDPKGGQSPTQTGAGTWEVKFKSPGDLPNTPDLTKILDHLKKERGMKRGKRCYSVSIISPKASQRDRVMVWF
jgi:hypothetical protein